MKLVIISDRHMIEDLGKAERMTDNTETAFFPKGFVDFPDNKMKRTLEKLYHWPKGTLNNHTVVRLPQFNQIDVRPTRPENNV